MGAWPLAAGVFIVCVPMNSHFTGRWGYRRPVVWRAGLGAVILMLALVQGLGGQPAQTASGKKVIVHGTVLDGDGKPAAGAVVSLQRAGVATRIETTTNGQGLFSFEPSPDGTFLVVAERSGIKSETAAVDGEGAVVLVVRLKMGGSGGGDALQFSDQPHFSVAGVTDWTAAGGHGSDTTLRTSESLANAAAGLKPSEAVTGSVNTSKEKHESADAFRLAARADERRGDPLLAVQEFEKAATLDPSEQNEFEWASELLLHRAIWEAEKVFRRGAAAYPTSLRMQAGLGAALFAGARYEEAAAQLCKASDLDVAAVSPYVFLGEIAATAPNALSCLKPRLERFVTLHPESAMANYLYGMALLKDRPSEVNAGASDSAKAYLKKAVSLDASCSEAYLQLGVLAATEHDQQAAIELYVKAIKADPNSADAHYRLGVSYDRVGEHGKAEGERALYQQMKQRQAEAVEGQRKAIKQFVFAKPDETTMAPGK